MFLIGTNMLIGNIHPFIGEFDLLTWAEEVAKRDIRKKLTTQRYRDSSGICGW